MIWLSLSAFPYARGEGDAVDAGASVGLAFIVFAGLADADRRHHSVLFRVHSHAVDLVHVDDSHVEHGLVVAQVFDAEAVGYALADHVVLAFERCPHAAVGPQRHSAQVSLDAADGADDIALQVRLDEGAGERKVHIALRLVQRDALDVTVLDAHVYGIGEFSAQGGGAHQESCEY